MSGRWKPRKLAEVAEPQVRPEPVVPDAEYRQLGVRLRGEGAYERETIMGKETKYPVLYRMEEEDIVVSKIWARKGSVGVVSEELAGTYGSPEFPTYRVKKDQLEPAFFAWLCKWPKFWDKCEVVSRGATSKSRLKPSRFLEIEVPLPDPPEQRRIVQRLDAVANRVREVQRLHEKLDRERDELLFSLVDDMKQRATWEPLQKVAPITRRPVTVEAGKEYPELGIRSFGKGTFHKPPLPAEEVGTKRLFWIKPGDLMFSNVFAWEGAIAVAKPEDEGRCGSHRFISCLCDSHRISAEFLCTYFLTNEGLAKIRAASPGAAGRNKTLGVGKLEAIPVPVPDRRDLDTFNRVYRHTMEARRQQGLIAQELETLLPATLDMAFRGEL